jgi:HNH endonuclease
VKHRRSKGRTPLEKAFRMPAVQSMGSRKTTITNAFVSAIIPVVDPTIDEISTALTILGMTAESVTCIYCGDKASAWDHLRPIVVDRRPTGYISEIANLVPACQPCNSSKGNSHWKAWMLGKAPQSPLSRNLVGLSERISKLEAYERWRVPIRVDLEGIIGAETYKLYWQELDRLVMEMERSQEMATKLRAVIADASDKWHVRPTAPTVTEMTP